MNSLANRKPLCFILKLSNNLLVHLIEEQWLYWPFWIVCIIKFILIFPKISINVFSFYWSAGPRRSSDESDVIVAGFLYMFVSIYISLSCRRVPTSFSQCFVLPPLQLSCQKDQPGHRCFGILNCLPPLLALCVLKHVCTRLIILTGGKTITR